MVSKARIGGIHDTLAYMNEMMDCDGLEISQNGETFPHDEFDSMHYDFICRCLRSFSRERASGVPWMSRK